MNDLFEDYDYYVRLRAFNSKGPSEMSDYLFASTAAEEEAEQIPLSKVPKEWNGIDFEDLYKEAWKAAKKRGEGDQVSYRDVSVS